MKKTVRIIAECFVVFVCVFSLTVWNLFSPLDYILRDGLYQRPRGVSGDIKIIGIDERTLERLGPVGTWSRSCYADLLDRLNEDEETRPLVIGFDIIFSGNVDEEGDQAFADRAEKGGNVVTASQLLYSEKAEMDENGIPYYRITGEVLPYEALRKAAISGYTNVAQDSDGTVRRILVEQDYKGESRMMFSQVIYNRYCDEKKIEPETVKQDKTGRTLINYSGKPGDYEYISFVDVLDGKIDTRIFKDCIVLVGAYAAGMQDNFHVPNGHSRQMFGVEIHANILQAFMQGRFSVNGNPYIAGILAGLFCALIHFLFRKMKIAGATILLAASAFAGLAVCTVLNNNGITVSILYVPLMLIVSYIYCLVFRYLAAKLKQRKVLNAFKKYVAPQVVEEIAKKGDFRIKLGGENRDIAVLFVDIRGFTTMSEALEPEQVVEILNQYLELTTECIFRNKGTLDKFVGDATMAVFNSPFDLEDYVYHAVCAAMDIVNGGIALEADLKKRFGRSVGFGVGVNCGPAVVGNIGCEFRMDFTAIGDTVNTAARLEANAGKGQVLISDEVYERLKDRIEVDAVGEIPLKGKSRNVFVYSLKAIKGKEDEQK